MTKAHSKLSNLANEILRQVRIKLSVYAYNRVILATSEVEVVEELQIQIGEATDDLA